MERNWKTIIIILGLIWVFSVLISSSTKIEGSTANIAIIRINGNIGGSAYSQSVNANEVVSELNKAEEMPNIEYVIIDINSPGGMPVDSERISNKVASMKKPTIAVVEDEATSGAYWIASGADEIIASNVSIVGSIGVLGSYLSFDGFLKKYGIGYNRLTAGEYKDIGTPFRNMSPNERKIYEERLKIMDDYFLNSVAKRRNLTEEEKTNISSALFYTGSQALKLHLIDKIGTLEDAVKLAGERINKTPSVYVFKSQKGFFEKLNELTSKSSFMVGYGIGRGLKVENFNQVPVFS